jgi:lipid-A-disaccharide synthase
VKIYIIAGEASGDLHGGNLVRAILRGHPGAQCRAWGGDQMAAAGATVVKHYRDLAFMGFLEVARNLRTIMRNFEYCRRDIQDFDPDTLVLIDYPGFNLRMARWARQQGLRVVYYIAPQVWAWHQSRVETIRQTVDELLVILPFEADFFARHGVKATFVGHPLLDAIGPHADWGGATARTIALLPGSRRQEVQRILPVMAAAAGRFPSLRFEVAASPTLPADLYRDVLQGHPHIHLVWGQTYALLQRSRAALVKSGTSTLETALYGVPQVVCYAGNPVSYAIARRLVRVPYISLVNLIANTPLVQELIQGDLHVDALASALGHILATAETERIREGYRRIRSLLGAGGASARAAGVILGT